MKKIIFLFGIIICLASCSSSKKFKSQESLDLTHVTKKDSAGISKVDSAGIKTAESSVVSTKDSSAVKSTTEESSEKITVNLQPMGPVDSSRSGRPANDYEDAPLIFDVTVNGNRIKSSQPINSIVVENKTGKQVIDASAVKTKDSGSTRSSEISNVSRFDSGHRSSSDSLTLEARKKAKETIRSGPSWGFWIPAVLITAALAILQWKFGIFTIFFAWIRRRRKKDPGDKNSNTLTSLKKVT